MLKKLGKKIEVAFFEVEIWEQDYLKSRLKSFNLKFFADPIEKVALKNLQNVAVISPFIYSKINQKILSDLPKVKLITTRSTGFDHIDLKATLQAKVKVTNVPFYGENTVAEHAFALILSISRNIHRSHERTMRGDFRLDDLQGFDLKSKTIGIIGGGHIGQHVARMAHGFEMNVLVYDPFPNKTLAKKLHFQYVTLENLLKKSDVITLHAPYNKKTHHLINLKNIKLIKPGSILINTARGQLADTPSFFRGFFQRIFLGMGLGGFVVGENKRIYS